MENSVGINLTFDDIVKRILSRKNVIIDFLVKVSLYNECLLMKCVARLITFEEEDAVQIAVVNTQNEFEYGKQLIDLKNNLNIIQRFSRTGIAYYNFNKNIFTWTEGIYNIIEKEPDKEDNRKNIFKRFNI